MPKLGSLGIGVESMISKRPHTIWRPLKRSLPIDGKGLGRLGYATGVVSIRRWIGKGYSSHHRRASSQDRGAARPVSCATSETGTGKTTGRAASVPHLSFNRKNLLLPVSCVCSKPYSRARSLVEACGGDDGGNLLSICRSLWHSTLNNTKTEEDVDGPGLVPIIKPLRLLLDAIEPAPVSGFIFPNIIGGALDLDNLFDRVIRPTLKADNLMWKGWQAYRRGLATNLKELGVPDTTIQCILGHENVNTTQRFYIKTASAVAVDAMKELEEKISGTAVAQ